MTLKRKQIGSKYAGQYQETQKPSIGGDTMPPGKHVLQPRKALTTPEQLRHQMALAYALRRQKITPGSNV